MRVRWRWACKVEVEGDKPAGLTKGYRCVSLEHSIFRLLIILLLHTDSVAPSFATKSLHDVYNKNNSPESGSHQSPRRHLIYRSWLQRTTSVLGGVVIRIECRDRETITGLPAGAGARNEFS